MKAGGFLVRLQKPNTGPHSNPDKSVHILTHYYFKIGTYEY
jgi:hypothetical protein